MSRVNLPLNKYVENGIKELNPEEEIGISVIKVYTQIAKFCNNPSRIDELRILRKAISRANGRRHVDSRFTIMKVSDVLFCFGEDLNSFPQTAVVLSLITK